MIEESTKPHSVYEIIEDSKGFLSSSKTAYLLVVATLCYIAISMEYHGRTDATVLGIVAMMGAGVYGMNKASETVTEKKKE